MNKYSKIRFALAVVFLFFSFRIVDIGVLVKETNHRVIPYIKRGLQGRIADFEKDYSEKGLKENVKKENFDKGLSELKDNLVRLENGEVFGAVGNWIEKILVFLSFFISILFFLNAVLILRRIPSFEIFIKFSYPLVVLWVIFLFFGMFNPMSYVVQGGKIAARIAFMLKGAEKFYSYDKFSMLRLIMLDPRNILFLSYILFVFAGIPFGLYKWIKKREES